MQLYESSRLIFLWLIPLLMLIFFWGKAQWKQRLSQLGDADFLQRRLMPGFSLAKRRGGWGLLVAVFFFSTLALARPQWGEEKKRVERKGLDVIFLLDTSLSMLAQDIKPDRLRKSKIEIKSLIRRFEGHRVGMVAFAGSSFLQCPLTLDYSAFLLFVDALKPGYLPNPGTSLSQAIELGIRAFTEESRKYRVLIVFSDGEDHEGGVEQAVEAASKAGVRIYTVGTGTTEGEPIPLRSATTESVSGYKKDRNGQVVITRLNAALLADIARETGGLYLPATSAEKEIEVILKHLETLGERKLRERLISEREDHFQLFLFIAFLLLVGETLLGNRRGRGGEVVIPVLAFFLLNGFMDSPKSLVEKGNRNVEQKKYQSAVEDYRKAQVSQPNEPIIRYNLGTTLYELYQYRDAEKELEQALTHVKDPTTKARILYNYGNTKYRLGDFEKAIDAYKKVLDINPKDEDAKFNLEFLKKQKAQFEKKQQERQQQKPQQRPDQQDRKDQEQQQPKPQPQQQGQQDQDEPQPEQQEGEQKEPKSSQQGGGQGDGKEGDQKEEQAEKGQQQKDRQDQEEKSEPEKQQQQWPQEEQGREQQEQQSGQEGQERKDQGGQGDQPLQGQMSKENALRILDALMEGEKQLQDLRRPPVQPDSDEVLKDW